MPHTSTDGLEARISKASCICSGANPTDKENPDGFYTNALGRCVECPSGGDFIYQVRSLLTIRMLYHLADGKVNTVPSVAIKTSILLSPLP